VNWKKHYHVPGLFFNDIRFTSTRKGKFYYLSDLVYRIIHKFCLKLCLYYYVRYSFFYRFQKSCININNNFSSRSFFLKRNINNILTHAHLIYSSDSENTSSFSTIIKKKKKLIVHFNFFIRITRHLMDKNMQTNRFFYHCFLISEKYSWLFKYSINFIFHLFTVIKSIITKKYSSNNKFFLLHQIMVIRFCIKYLMFFLDSMLSLITIYKSYMKQSPLLNNIDTSSLSVTYTNTTILYDLYKSKNIVPISTSWKKNYFLYINHISNSFHDLFSHFFFLRKLNLYKSLKFINYVNTNNLIYKKEIINKFRKQFRLFKAKFRKYRSRYAYRFYTFLIRIFYAKKNWLLGPVHKTKFFKYIFIIYNKIKLTFKNLFLFKNSSVKKKGKFSFFFDSSKIREHFFLYLGKKRYSEEFLLLKNKKWYLKFYIKHFYNIDFKFLWQYNKELRKKYNISQIKDLFLFIEHHIDVFENKYLNLNRSTNSNVIIHERSIVSNKLFFFIGDSLKINISLLNQYKYEKFYIFFNIIYFINPLFFDRKWRLLSDLYIYLYNHLFCQSLFMFKENINWDHLNIDHLNINIKKIIHYLSIFFKSFDYNDYIKTLHLLFNRFNIHHLNDKWGNLNFINGDVSYINTINKVYLKLNLIKWNILNGTNKKRIQKPFWWFKNIKADKSFWRRKKRNRISKNFFTNFYKFYKYNFFNASTNAKNTFYKDNVYTKLNYKNYKSHLSKKIFFLDTDSKLSNIL